MAWFAYVHHMGLSSPSCHIVREIWQADIEECALANGETLVVIDTLYAREVTQC